MATIDVKDATGATVTVAKVAATGQVGQALALPVVLANDLAQEMRQTITRPANTTAYTAGDVWGPAAAALTLATGLPSGGAGVITQAMLEVDLAAIPATMTTFRLHLYNVTPPSALADNAAFDIPAGDRASYLGFIDLGAPEDLGSTLWTQVLGISFQFKLSGSANLFGYLETKGAYTPTSAEVIRLYLQFVGL